MSLQLSAQDIMLVTAISIGVNGFITGPGIPIGVSWAHDTFMTIASQNLKLLYAVEDEMVEIQNRIDNGTATSEDLQRMATLKERRRNLAQ